ncbi:MAG: radical SAM protein [Phycisphaeraceae bacterium]|nr:radical SAM protein [Phycisphaeraceae bacterium]
MVNPLPVIQPSNVTIMIKPVGALCNLDCTYCYYLPTKTVFDGHEHRMKLQTLESVFASILPRFGDQVTIAWQGGEPTLAGLKFFERAIEFQEKYRKPGQTISHALQTNGTLLDDDWCRFLKRHEFLVGLSVDGPAKFHDHYRLTNSGRGSIDQVLRGLGVMQRHAVDYNILCVLNDVNVKHPDEILKYLLRLGSRWVQFIPAIEWEPDPEQPGRNRLAPYSPRPEDYGRFLCRVFDAWFEKHRMRLSVRIFDAVLNRLVLGIMPFCILDGSCHNQLTVEHDGSVFGCDHFVEKRWQLGLIGDRDFSNSIDPESGHESVGLTIHGQGYLKNSELPGRDIQRPDDLERYEGNARSEGSTASSSDEDWYDRVETPRLATFASRKQKLPEGCQSCQWKPYCYGGCPKHREHGGDIPEPTILCEAYKMFYSHAMPRLQWLAGYLRRGVQPPPAVPATNVGHSEKVGSPKRVSSGKIGRNDPCPCGSGLKYKHCHGKRQAPTPTL